MVWNPLVGNDLGFSRIFPSGDMVEDGFNEDEMLVHTDDALACTGNTGRIIALVPTALNRLGGVKLHPNRLFISRQNQLIHISGCDFVFLRLEVH